jgi:hypothetical protein
MLRDIGYARTSMLELVCDRPVEQIRESHHKIAAWGWTGPHA